MSSVYTFMIYFYRTCSSSFSKAFVVLFIEKNAEHERPPDAARKI